jgi:plastocyanin
MRRAWLTVALAVASMTAAVIAPAIAADAPPTATVEMRQQTFVPATLDVAPGTTIEWINRDSIPHSATAEGSFDSGPILPGKSFRWTAKDAAAIDYRCIFHPSMTAKVVVQQPRH